MPNAAEARRKLFVSYNTEIEPFVAELSHCLQRQAQVDPYFHPERRKAGDFSRHIEDAIRDCDSFVFLVSAKTHESSWQCRELETWLSEHGRMAIERLVIVRIAEAPIPSVVQKKELDNVERLDVPADAVSCSNALLELLDIHPAPFDDLPTSLEARYEKEIITAFVRGGGEMPAEKVERGYPRYWPQVQRIKGNAGGLQRMDNPLSAETFGAHRSDSAAVFVDARVDPGPGAEDGPHPQPLTFPEAGPRATVLYKTRLKVAILVSGGIAPGSNAVISGIVDRHRAYERECKKEPGRHNHHVEIVGCLEGFKALCRTEDDFSRFKSLSEDQVRRWANRGGSLLPTARADELLEPDPAKREKVLKEMVETLRKRGIDVLYVIGGEGSMRAAHALWTVFKQRHPERPLAVVGVPKTTDNDILWVWQSFGFLSAVEKSRQNLIQLHTEVTSNPRVGVVQLFGSASGFVVSHAALGSNVCDLALIPEMDFSMLDVCKYMRGRLVGQLGDGQPPSGLIVMAETAIPNDFERFIDRPYVGLTRDEKDALRAYQAASKKVIGQTPDALRSAGLKIVSKVLQQYIQVVMGRGGEDGDLNDPQVLVGGEYWRDFRVLTNEPRHTIRSTEPSVTDVAYGIRLGTMAVDTAMAGYTDCMASQWLTEYVVVPLKLVVLGRKQVPLPGIFWRTVISKTGQMDYPALT